jgi:hypothetical protein
MRLSLAIVFATGLACCGNSEEGADSGAMDLSVPMDMSASSDMPMVVPFNMPGSIDCYGSTCSTSSASPVCCDSSVDGGFTDTCVASSSACLAMDPQAKAFQCGQAADCSGGQVCCGNLGTSNSGKSYFVATACAASCSSGQTQLCVSTGECKAAGVQCVGATISGRDVGLCK